MLLLQMQSSSFARETDTMIKKENWPWELQYNILS